MYDFKINKIVTNDNTTIIPKNINVIIGPNNSGKSQFLKDIKNILGLQQYFDKKNIIIKDMKYNLPKNKEEFIERYDLNSKVFKNSNNQYYIRNYSGVFNNNIAVDNSINNYLDTGNININGDCEKVYICEAESDEEFFQSLHDKINPYDSAFFTHGKNKQTLKDISNAYKELNIPNYRIYDFDILRDDDFNKALNTFIDEDVKNKYINIRKELNETFDKDSYQNGGIEKITDDNLKNKVLRMLVDLKKSKIIILKHGCLESCLLDLDINYTKNKNTWFKDAINLINNSGKELIESSHIYNWIFK